ncbi:MAG: glycosyltransferase [candidate division Zixibacteria bacterium]|nr:glycosyltransferase [candidate division Zixibacteria bacterium]
MKILYLAHSGSPHTQKWVRHFVQRGDEVHVASLVNESIEGAVIHPLRRPTGTKLDYFFNIGLVKKLAKELKPDILHAHYATSYGFLGALGRFRPLVISSWGMDVLGFPETSPFHRRLLRWSLSRADAVCATSHQLAEATKKYLPKEKKTTVTPFGVDPQVFRSSSNDRIPGVTIGIAKTLEPKYGVEYLIRAFALVHKKIPTIRLLIIGKGYLQIGLQKLAAELQLSEKIEFVGRVPHKDVPNWLGKIDVFVNPSVHESETFGVAVVEASAMEIPVVVSRVGGLPEVVQDGVTGFLVPPKDVNALAEKIELLASDENLRRRMGKAGREFVKKNYDWNENAKIMERLYDSLVKK